MAEGHEEEEEEEEVAADLEPFFYDEAEAVADHQRRLLREAEALRQEQIHMDRLARVLDYDEQGYRYYTRCGFPDLANYDPEEESSLGPMRYTDNVYKGEDDAKRALCIGVNVLSVKMVKLDDLKFPIHVYGTVVARDSIDSMCVYLFRRDEDQCQVINSEAESLILTGPKRGLLLLSDIFIEIYLKIKDPRQQKDLELSRGFVSVKRNSMARRLKNVVESKSLESKLSTVEVVSAVMLDAVEATIDIQVLEGKFYGEITACTTSILDKLVLHDSKLAAEKGGCGEGTIQLLRSVVTVDIKDMLLISTKTDDGKFEGTIEFTPRVSCWDDDVVIVGATRMRVRVTWSKIH